MPERLRFLTAGESHGPKLTVILDGMPAGVPFDHERINNELTRRQTGFGRGGRMKIEKDEVVFTAGVAEKKTTGAPICMEIANLDYKSWNDKKIEPMTIPRPGHADLSGAIKFGHDDLRLSLERASARETAARVAAGAVCKELLAQFGISVGGYVSQIGSYRIEFDDDASVTVLKKRVAHARKSEFALPEKNHDEKVREEIHRAMKAKDTLGGHMEIFAFDVPAGLGSYTQWDRKLEAQIGSALLSIQAMKGVEFARAFDNAQKRGTQVHDEIFADKSGHLYRKTNRSGGFEGGMTTGEPIWARVAMKPISTTLNPLRSVDLATKKAAATKYERSDFCAYGELCVVQGTS
jgi:chorismate synthase